jgi:hypothetical protein
LWLDESSRSELASWPFGISGKEPLGHLKH